MDPLRHPPSVTLSVVMPCYNEADHIEETLRTWHEALSEEVDSFELIVVNDGSMDGTGRVLDRLRKEIPTLRALHQLNGGHDFAVRRGYEAARGSYILQCDTNGRFDPSDFAKLWEKRESGLVLSRPEPDREGGFASLYDRFIRGLARLLFGCEARKPGGSFRLIRRDYLQGFLGRLPRSVGLVNLGLTLIIHRLAPAAVTEVAIPFRFRNGLRRPSPWLFRAGALLHVLVDVVGLRLNLLTLRLPVSLSRWGSPNAQSPDLR